MERGHQMALAVPSNARLMHLLVKVTTLQMLTLCIRLLRSACTTIELFFVEADEVESSTLPAITLPSVPGTMKLHQLKTSGTPGTITYQDVSCFCANLHCSCFSQKIFTFPVVSSTESEERSA